MNTVHNNFNIFLLKKAPSFDKYIDRRAPIVEKKNINKSLLNLDFEFITSGKIYIFERTLTQPSWLNFLNSIKSQKDNIYLADRKDYASIIFLETKLSHTVAISFGKIEGLILSEYIVPNFGLTTAKYFIDVNSLKSISFQSFDPQFTKINKSSTYALNATKLTPAYEISTINSFQGKTNINGFNITLNGNDSLKVSGKISIPTGLVSILKLILETYSSRENLEMKFNLNDGIKPVVDTKVAQLLNKTLEQKLHRIFNSASKLNNNSLKNISLNPEFNFPLEHLIGYRITGIGIPTSVKFDEIDTAYIFEKIQLKLPKDPDLETIYKKLENMKIKAVLEDSTEEFEVSFFKSLFYETTIKQTVYFLYKGNWYEVFSNFYYEITDVIDNLNTENVLNYIKYEKYDKKNQHGFKNENEYNDMLVSKNQKLSLDCTKYKPNADVRKNIDLHHSSNIEIADILNTTSEKLQFIHIKRKTKNSGASQTIHLFSQAKASAQIYLYDKNNVQHFINEQVTISNKKNIFQIVPIDFNKPYNLQIVLTIITDKKVSRLSKLFTLLERISLYETYKFLISLGYELIVNLVDSD